ncbi:MAG: hypothetical protein ACFCVH_06555 [Alphaproteobacteria bacterium]
MTIIEQVDGWTYAAHPASTPDVLFGDFAPAVAMWRAKARPGALPRKRDFSLPDFRGWFGWVIIYDVQADPFDLRFRLFGSQLAERLRLEHTGKRFSEAYAHVPGHEVTLRHFRALWRHRMIGTSSGPMNWEGQDFHSGRFIDLPVADNAGELAHFFTFARLGDSAGEASIMLGSRACA